MAKAPMLLRAELCKALGISEDATRLWGSEVQRVVGVSYMPWEKGSSDVRGSFLDAKFYGPDFLCLFVVGLMLQADPTAQRLDRYLFNVATRMEKGELLYGHWNYQREAVDGTLQTAEVYAQMMASRLQAYLETDVMQGTRKSSMGFF